MRKLLLIVLILLLMGAVSAHDDINGTDEILKDTEYNSNIDDDEILEVEQNDYIPVEIEAGEPWSLNVYIDSHDSAINGEYINVAYERVDIPTSAIVNGKEEPLALGQHNIVYEFRFTNTTSLYKPECSVSDTGIYFDFEFVRNMNKPQNSIYRFSSKLNVVEPIVPTTTTLNPSAITITQSDTLSFSLGGINYANMNFYINEGFVKSFEADENPFEDELDTSRLAIGSYNLVCIVETNKIYGDYNVTADTSKSMLDIHFGKASSVLSPRRYITIVNTTLNVCDIPELNPIHISAPQVNISYTRSVPIRLEGEGSGNLVAYIDGVKVYENPIMLSWENTLYVPTKDSSGNYFDEGLHNITFELVFDDKYSAYRPYIYWYSDALTFDFRDSEESGTFLNDIFIISGKLNIINKNPQFIKIDSRDTVRIVHTDDIRLKVNTLPDTYSLTVFVDDVEIYDARTSSSSVSVKTFFPRTSIDETNERDIQVGSHSIRFEFASPYTCDASAEFINGEMRFSFTQTGSYANPNGVFYQLKTSLIVTEKQKTVHILNVKNNTYFDDTEFIVKMDTYAPEDPKDWDDDDEENPIGTQDVGVIISNDDGVLYIGDDLINVYRFREWNHDFENEKLPKAGIYTIKIINLADNTYDTATFEVKKVNRVFTRKYTSDDFNVLFKLDFSSCRSDLNSPLTISLAGEEKTINVKKSTSKKREVLFKDIDPGTYTATFTLKGNDIYNDVTLKTKVTVKKEEPKITCHSIGSNKLEIEIDIGESKTDGVLVVSAGGVEKKFTVDKNTRRLTVDFSSLGSGSYNVKIYFKGNERYTSKTVNGHIEVRHYPQATHQQVPEEKETVPEGHGFGDNKGGIGTGSGDGNVLGSGNGTFNGRMSSNAKGSGGNLGSQGSGHGEGVKSYEITKNIKEIHEIRNTLPIVMIIALGILILGILYERREKEDSEEY